MNNMRSLAKPLSLILSLCLLNLGLFSAGVHAAMIDTQTALRAEQGQGLHDRERVISALHREDVRHYLIKQGVDPTVVEQRVQALTDDEASAIAQRLDQLPAGGDVVGAIVFVFLVLLVTDILGFTDVFPFVKKRAR